MTTPDPHTWNAWPYVWEDYDPATDDPARQRVLGEFAARTLHRLDRLQDELYALSRELRFLAEAARVAELPSRVFLIDEAIAVGALVGVVPEALRDMAARFPIRGLDYEGEPC
jgi:hypothetical protein